MKSRMRPLTHQPVETSPFSAPDSSLFDRLFTFAATLQKSQHPKNRRTGGNKTCDAKENRKLWAPNRQKSPLASADSPNLLPCWR